MCIQTKQRTNHHLGACISQNNIRSNTVLAVRFKLLTIVRKESETDIILLITTFKDIFRIIGIKQLPALSTLILPHHPCLLSGYHLVQYS